MAVRMRKVLARPWVGVRVCRCLLITLPLLKLTSKVLGMIQYHWRDSGPLEFRSANYIICCQDFPQWILKLLFAKGRPATFFLLSFKGRNKLKTVANHSRDLVWCVYTWNGSGRDCFEGCTYSARGWIECETQGCVPLGWSGSGSVIQDLSGSWCIKGTGESMTRVDSPVPLMRYDPHGSRITDPDLDHPKGT